MNVKIVLYEYYNTTIHKMLGFLKTNTTIHKMLGFLKTNTIIAFNMCKIYLIWICIHYLAGILYCRYCTQTTFIGFILSPFMVGSPHCIAFRWIIYNGGIVITNMWLILGTWIAAHLLSHR
jgi:hypothetical protein